MPFSPLVERAMRVAARWHRHQTRKSSDLPYITHPASVMSILMRVGIHDDEILAASLLHDVLEDTPCPLAELCDEFPPRVIEFVKQLTEDKQDVTGATRPWQVRKSEYIDRLRDAPWEVRAIALADKLHNLGTMLFDLDAGEPIWRRFGAPPERVLWYHDEVVREAAQDDPLLASLAAECLRIIRRLRDTLDSNC